MHRTLRTLLLVLPLAACTRHVDDDDLAGPASATARVDLLIEDAALDDLAAFPAWLEGYLTRSGVTA